MKSASAFTSSNDHVPTDVFANSGCRLELSHPGDSLSHSKSSSSDAKGLSRSIAEGGVAGSAINASTASGT